jgi:hypothetical protein
LGQEREAQEVEESRRWPLWQLEEEEDSCVLRGAGYRDGRVVYEWER